MISVKLVAMELMSSFRRLWYDLSNASLVGGTAALPDPLDIATRSEVHGFSGEFYSLL